MQQQQQQQQWVHVDALRELFCFLWHQKQTGKPFDMTAMCKKRASKFEAKKAKAADASAVRVPAPLAVLVDGDALLRHLYTREDGQYEGSVRLSTTTAESGALHASVEALVQQFEGAGVTLQVLAPHAPSVDAALATQLVALTGRDDAALDVAGDDAKHLGLGQLAVVPAGAGEWLLQSLGSLGVEVVLPADPAQSRTRALVEHCKQKNAVAVMSDDFKLALCDIAGYVPLSTLHTAKGSFSGKIFRRAVLGKPVGGVHSLSMPVLAALLDPELREFHESIVGVRRPDLAHLQKPFVSRLTAKRAVVGKGATVAAAELGKLMRACVRTPVGEEQLQSWLETALAVLEQDYGTATDAMGVPPLTRGPATSALPDADEAQVREQLAQAVNIPAEPQGAKAHTSAVILCPPPSMWGEMQAVRAVHDKGFVRWPPHVNLLYPFVKEADFEAEDVVARLTAALADVKPFTVRFEAVEFFAHRYSCTLWMRPDVPERPNAVLEVQARVEAAIPHCAEQSLIGDDGFAPHMSIGQCKTRQEAETLQTQFQSDISPIEFEVRELYVIARGAKTPFNAYARIPLGGDDGGSVPDELANYVV